MRYFGSSADQKDAIAREYIDGKLAPVETSPATAAHAAGDLLIYNGTLYRATADIAIGDTLTVGTNISATDLDEVASLLKSAINNKADIDLGITGASAGQVATVSAVDDNGKPTAWDVSSVKRTLTVTAVTQDGVTVTGQTVTVREGGAEGSVFATAAYEGQPVSFALPVGFVYYVSVSDTLAHHFNPTTASGIVTDTNISVTLTYSDFSNIRTAADIKGALNNDIDLTDLVGEQITCSKGSGTLTWDVADYDATEHSVTLLLHDCLPDNMVFEPAQASAYFENGLAAGDYSLTIGSTTYYFTLANVIPAGGQLRVTTSAYSVYASQDASTASETGTASTTAITGATNLGTTGSDAGLYPINHWDRVQYGSNNFGESALYQWLNSDAAANTPVTRITKFSRRYAYSVAGFKSGLDADFLAAIGDTAWKCNTNNVYEAPASMGGIAPKSTAYTVTAKFGLASEKEVFGSYGGTNAGDSQFDLYVGAQASDRIKYYNNSARYWWLRSPLWYLAYYERNVHTSGAVNGNYASDSVGVAPACKIYKSA